ncbi:3-oxoacyl-ACP reductase FabG [Gordonia pseudamarae]|jgi:3-oxoacyl-[acyl-carrier protein] reductase|uniref:3-oxoacyl-ACP reductase FabG n=2 Tax=Gordonia TaxID=2053 RepID=A0ABX6IJA4_9ACTN|nr:3-oxoacyl-ACP reductase FabG [Gordonia sp. (in: high G+C Gram-positive bacteria)]QHN27084.1 3-oxoacyl-ACP reductase FabG [Gordonia pseudamarae]QHN35973.1 3-oxoacyl-ACP reductase FabG [Gordonia pseudamarae]
MVGLLADKRAVVTGAAQGIGLAIATELTAHGAKVALIDLDAKRAGEAAAQLGADAIGIGADVTSEEDMRAAADAVVGAWGGLDIWVNNAGVTRDASLRKMTLADFELVIDVHLRGSWLGVREAAAIMRGKGGSIINLSSMSGKIGNPGQTNYSAAKAGIVGLTKAAAKELAHHGVRVNAVAPGLIRTPMTAAMSAEAFAATEATIPMRRAGEPREVAGVVAFLASDLAGYVTGTVTEVSGGRGM